MKGWEFTTTNVLLKVVGKPVPVITEILIDEIGEGLGCLERHEVTGRVVAIME